MSKAFFIKNRACFGGFPTQEQVLDLEEKGVVLFVNLTNNYERKITPYKTSKEYLHYPIKDRNIPRNIKSFAKLILIISERILSFKKGEKLYLHCKGGHGRAGIVVAILLCHMFNLPPIQSIAYTTKYHNTREMKEKWRKIGSPQTKEQKNFVKYFCQDIFFNDKDAIEKIQGFSLFSPHKIYIPNIGVFSTAESAFQNLNEESKIQNIDQILFIILKYKFDQYSELYKNLLNTGLSKIYYYNPENKILGVSDNKKGENKLGKQLVNLRNYYYKN